MIRALHSFDVKQKRVLMRVDFNVPIENDRVVDSFRIRSAIPSIKDCLESGTSLVLMSHLGRPNGKIDEKYSLVPVGEALSDILEIPIKFSYDCISEDAINVTIGLHPGEIHLLENLRFHLGETNNDPEFAGKLARHGQIYINDAFGTAHRSHASNVGVTEHFTEKGMGYLMEKELQFLLEKFKKPKHPLLLILGGAKISGKLHIIDRFLDDADTILIGGGMAFTFLKALGVEVGRSMVDRKMVSSAKEIIVRAKRKRVKLVFPVDFVIAEAIENPKETKMVAFDSIPDSFMGLDIGTETINIFSDYILGAGTILWNGPMGVFEKKEFENGTKALSKMLSLAFDKGVDTIVGGGESAAAVRKFGMDEKMTHVSTGGGASLELLSGYRLPALEALGR
ncbi:MAG: phosphoglycerate kinase [Candidatus Neomarinimicrobiota bacterium]|nr:phosphoglycerate kinase [Candidatus Neomarinimicrobiota bacterium]